MCDRNECDSDRIIRVDAKCSDQCAIEFYEELPDHDGYVPEGLNVGGNDYIEFKVCLYCGKIQGKFPITIEDVEAVTEAIADGKY